VSHASNITVIQHGGTIVDQDGKEITGALNEIYKPGQELIVFLNVSPTAGGITVAYDRPAASWSWIGKSRSLKVSGRTPSSAVARPFLRQTFVQLLRQLAVTKTIAADGKAEDGNQGQSGLKD
jgi:hypothetical protein